MNTMYALRDWLTDMEIACCTFDERLRSHRSAHASTSELNLPKLNNFHGKIAQNQAPVWLSIVLNISCLYTCIFQLCNR